MVRKTGDNSNLTTALIAPRVETPAVSAQSTIKSLKGAPVLDESRVPSYIPSGSPSSRIFKRLSTIRDAGAESPASATLQASVRAFMETSSSKGAKPAQAVTGHIGAADMGRAAAIAQQYLAAHIAERDATILEHTLIDGDTLIPAGGPRMQFSVVIDSMRAELKTHLADREEAFAVFKATT